MFHPAFIVQVNRSIDGLYWSVRILVLKAQITHDLDATPHSARTSGDLFVLDLVLSGITHACMRRHKALVVGPVVPSYAV